MAESAEAEQVAAPSRYLNRARALVTALEAGEDGDVSRLIDELTTLRETQLFKELGKLTRDLHDSFTAFCEDSRFQRLASSDVPDARERLKHVITLTQNSADKTLNAVENCVPLAKGISDRASALSDRWQEFRERRLSLAEFRQLSGELDAFLKSTQVDADAVHAGLSEVVMAQEFQDLTGQIIQRVISLVDEVEDKLVSIIALAGARLREEQREEPDRKDEAGCEGPPIPVLSGADVVSGQDEVDELLSSLGF